MDRWLSKRQVCLILGISSATLDRYKAKGVIPYYKISDYKSGKVRFKEKDVLEFLEKQKFN